MFTEIFRASWATDIDPPQWNVVASQSNVLRGVHAHWRHGDYLVVLQGQMVVGLYDLRCSSSTYRASTFVDLRLMHFLSNHGIHKDQTFASIETIDHVLSASYSDEVDRKFVEILRPIHQAVLKQ
jgi:hypothetical protein